MTTGKTVFLFPGQGSQEIGMARDLFRDDGYFISLIEKASAITGEDLARLCLKGPEKKLSCARFLQPLLVAVSLGYARHLTDKKIRADYVLGHSLGEITALAAAEVVTDTAAIEIAAKRGELMDEAASAYPGGMLAVLALKVETIQELIREAELTTKVFIANMNAPEQSVVSGESAALDILSRKACEAGGTCKKLNVAGPWHSPYLEDAYEKFQAWAQPLTFREPRVPIIFNAIAKPESDPEKIKEIVALQLSGPVYFKQCLEYCRLQNAGSFLEIGPGRVLSGIVRANGFAQGVDVYNVNNLKGVLSAAADLAGH